MTDAEMDKKFDAYLKANDALLARVDKLENRITALLDKVENKGNPDGKANKPDSVKTAGWDYGF